MKGLRDLYLEVRLQFHEKALDLCDKATSKIKERRESHLKKAKSAYFRKNHKLRPREN